MLRKDRERYIQKLLEEDAIVSVSDLSERLSLSEVSVRKLLSSMEKEGLLRRIWGGAVGLHSSLSEPTYEDRNASRIAEKRAIARMAYDCIMDGDAVYIDSGTTALHLAHLLAGGTKRKVLVCTNALNIAMEFRQAEDMEVILIGGVFHHRILSCSGGMARAALGTLHFDKGFLTGSHFSLDQGLTTPNLQEAEIKRAILTAAKEVFVLADSSKYGSASLAQIASCAEMRTLITDWQATPEMISGLSAAGIRVLCAEG